MSQAPDKGNKIEFNKSAYFDSVRPTEADELTGTAEPRAGCPRVRYVGILEAANADWTDEVGRGQLYVISILK